MKKHSCLVCAARALAFLLLLVLLLSLLSVLFRPKDNTKEAGMHYLSAHGHLGEPEDSLDVIFLGDSMTYSAYTPLEIWERRGFTSYVSAMGGGTMNNACDLLSEILERQHPKVIVLEAHVAARDTMLNDAILTEATNLLSIFGDHDGWKDLSPKSLLAPVRYTYQDEDKGFWPRQLASAADTEGYMAATEEKLALSPVTRFYLDRFIRLCQRSDVTLLIVGVPSTINWNMEKHNAIQEIADQYGVTFLDLDLLTEEVGIDWATDTQDEGDHLNNSGARKVSAYISDYLTEHYSLPDHREDPAYSSWNDAAAAYWERMAR